MSRVAAKIGRMRLKDLSAPEQALWKAFPLDEWVDLCQGDPRVDDPGQLSAGDPSALSVPRNTLQRKGSGQLLTK
jgi:hypothetical protein